MDSIDPLYDGLMKFINIFIIKYKYENRGILKKLRIDHRLNMKLDNEKWSELFLYKSCYNHCAKFILLRYIEDSKLCYGKMNEKGVCKWKELVKNISGKISILYEIAILDLQKDENEQIRKIFKYSDYDLFKIDDELANVLYEKFLHLDFSNFSKNDLVKIFERIYSLEEREEMRLDKFYKVAPVFSHLLSLDNQESIV
ncbi:hypothetical protein IZY60_00605 [Lutibacter sp. B2]|nr:hypothetical protein [Lutibacter sp. B2]